MKLTGDYNIRVIEDEVIIQELSSLNKIPDGAVCGLLADLFNPTNYTTIDTTVKAAYYFDGVYGASSSSYPDTCAYNTLTTNNIPLYTSVGSAPTVTDGLNGSGSAIRFGGATCLTNRNTMDQTSDADFTIEAWVRIQSTNSGVVFSYNGAGASAWSRANLLLVNGVPSFGTANATPNACNFTTSTLGALSTNVWHHIAGVHSNAYGNFLYVDGKLAQKNTTFSGTVGTVAGSLWVGGQNGQSLNGVTYFTGDVANPMYFATSTRYTGTIVGSKYFTPQKRLVTKNRSYLPPYSTAATNSTFRPTTLILCAAQSTIAKYDCSYIDDYVHRGVYVRNSADYIVDLNSQLDVNALTTTVTSNSVKLSLLIPEDFAIGYWNGIILTDTVNQNRTNNTLDTENITYPIISKLNLPSTITKRRKAKLQIDWTLQLAQS